MRDVEHKQFSTFADANNNALTFLCSIRYVKLAVRRLNLVFD